MLRYIHRLIESMESFIVRADHQYSIGLEKFLSSKGTISNAELEYWIRIYDQQMANRRCWVE